MQKHAFWALIGRDRFYGVIWTRCEEYKKERTKSKPKFATFADPLPVVPHQPNFARRVVSRISFLVLSFRKIGWKCGSSTWGVEFLAFPLTWHIAYTTACCYRTSRDFLCFIISFLHQAYMSEVKDCKLWNTIYWQIYNSVGHFKESI